VVRPNHDPLVWLYTAAQPFRSTSWLSRSPGPRATRLRCTAPTSSDQGVTHVLLAGPDADGADELQRLLVRVSALAGPDPALGLAVGPGSRCGVSPSGCMGLWRSARAVVYLGALWNHFAWDDTFIISGAIS